MSQKKYQCPICKQSYSIASMANHCQRTSVCRKFNFPSHNRLHSYLQQYSVATSLLYFYLPVQEKYSDQYPELTALVSDASEVYEKLPALFVNTANTHKAEQQLIHFLTLHWDGEAALSCSAIVSGTLRLVESLLMAQEDFWKNNPDMDLQEIWKKVEADIHAVESFFPANEEDTLFDFAIDDLMDVIWPRVIDPVERDPLRLYLVRDKFWVVAHDRDEVRAIMKKEYGFTSIRGSMIEHLQPGQKMEDGSTASDLIKLARGEAMIVGRTE